MLEAYTDIVGRDVIEHLRQLVAPLRGMKVVHVNSTREGGGVAEILHKLVPLQQDLGIDSSWEVITGNPDFYDCTKSFHNGLQGNRVMLQEGLLQNYMKTNEENCERLRGTLAEADMVFIHDPQPAAFLHYCPERKGKWIWRCHIDASTPYRPVWRFLRELVKDYDASIFSLAAFAQRLPHPIYLIPPSIDPLTDKNIDLDAGEVTPLYARFGLDPERPIMTQVSRFDRFKDPLGVVQAYRLTKKFYPTLQLVLAGGGASDDPEGAVVLDEVNQACEGDGDAHVLMLPPDAHRTINGLQRLSDIVLQKSIREGFGLTVTEAMWKGKPVIGGNTGGIRLQIVNHHTGFLVSSPEGAALRIRFMLRHRDRTLEMGRKAREFVRENFLLTRLLREHLTLMAALNNSAGDRIELN